MTPMFMSAHIGLFYFHGFWLASSWSLYVYNLNNQKCCVLYIYDGKLNWMFLYSIYCIQFRDVLNNVKKNQKRWKTIQIFQKWRFSLRLFLVAPSKCIMNIGLQFIYFSKCLFSILAAALKGFIKMFQFTTSCIFI